MYSNNNNTNQKRSSTQFCLPFIMLIESTAWSTALTAIRDRLFRSSALVSVTLLHPWKSFAIISSSWWILTSSEFLKVNNNYLIGIKQLTTSKRAWIIDLEYNNSAVFAWMKNKCETIYLSIWLFIRSASMNRWWREISCTSAGRLDILLKGNTNTVYLAKNFSRIWRIFFCLPT